MRADCGRAGRFSFIYKSVLVLISVNLSNAFSASFVSPLFRHRHVGTAQSIKQAQEGGDVPSSSMEAAFDAAVMNRYACKNFERFDNNMTATDIASPSNPEVVKLATSCLDLARRAPSGFNAQPYKVVLVHTPSQKDALSKACIGQNAKRVRDSDCTAVFCADREVIRTMKQYGDLVKSSNKALPLRKIQIYIALFSSGYPLPRFLAVPISFGLRTVMSVISFLLRRVFLLPSLSSAETWSIKNTMLVTMTYMLGCSSRGLTTCPMEGFYAGGIKSALGIPRRYSIPVIVATGRPYNKPKSKESDGVGMTHGSPATGSKNATPRYPLDEVVYGDRFGDAITNPA